MHTVTISHPRFIGLVKDLILCGAFCKQHHIAFLTTFESEELYENDVFTFIERG